jgi:hypothetical protein
MPNYRRAFVPALVVFIATCAPVFFQKIGRATLIQAESSARDEDAAANGIRRRENKDGGLRWR